MRTLRIFKDDDDEVQPPGVETWAYGDFSSEEEALRFMEQHGVTQMDGLVNDEGMFN